MEHFGGVPTSGQFRRDSLVWFCALYNQVLVRFAASASPNRVSVYRLHSDVGSRGFLGSCQHSGLFRVLSTFAGPQSSSEQRSLSQEFRP